MPKKTHNLNNVSKRSLGGLLGSVLGGLGSTFFPIKNVNGAELGRQLGEMTGLKRGGVRRRRRGGK